MMMGEFIRNATRRERGEGVMLLGRHGSQVSRGEFLPSTGDLSRAGSTDIYDKCLGHNEEHDVLCRVCYNCLCHCSNFWQMISYLIWQYSVFWFFFGGGGGAPLWLSAAQEVLRVTGVKAARVRRALTCQRRGVIGSSVVAWKYEFNSGIKKREKKERKSKRVKKFSGWRTPMAGLNQTRRHTFHINHSV